MDSKSQRSEEVNNANGFTFNLETAYSALRTNALPTAAVGSKEEAPIGTNTMDRHQAAIQQRRCRLRKQ